MPIINKMRSEPEDELLQRVKDAISQYNYKSE